VKLHAKGSRLLLDFLDGATSDWTNADMEIPPRRCCVGALSAHCRSTGAGGITQ